MYHFLWKKTVIGLLFLPLILNLSWALSPPNITADIPWTDSGGSGNNSNYGGVADIEAAFNFGRSQERSQLGLPASAIKNLVMPSQAVWDGMSINAKALFLLNDERTSRSGMQTGVIGLPFAGIEQNIDGISDTYTTLLHDTNTWGHFQPSGNSNIDSPFIRIQQDSEIGTAKNCHEFINRSENLAVFAGFTSGTATAALVPLPLERSIYNWIYNDSGSNWGHREAALLQDVALSNLAGTGFENNNGSNTHEGFLGVHVMGSTTYEYFTTDEGDQSYQVVVVMNIFDPVSDTDATTRDCNYTVTQSTESLSGNQAPTAVDDVVTTAFNTVKTDIEVLANDTDPENDTLSVINNTNPANGVVEKTGDTFTYTPNTGFSGSDSFSYTISDGSGNSVSATVTVLVNPATQSQGTINIIPIITLLLLDE